MACTLGSFQVFGSKKSVRSMALVRFSCTFHSVGLGGFCPNFASYTFANLSARLGLQRKHCDSGRSCSSHQSPFSLKLATSEESHRAHSSSGTPCSGHHQPPSLTAVAAASLVAPLGDDSEEPQPVSTRTDKAKTTNGACVLQLISLIRFFLGK